MLEQLILETKARHSKKAISSEAFHKWRNSAVTKRLFEDLELAVIDSYQDYLPEDSEGIIVSAMLRQGATQLVEKVLDWMPAGIYIEEEEDDSDE